MASDGGGADPSSTAAPAGPRRFGSGMWRAADLVALKARKATTVSVVLPALNEEQTVGEIVTTLRVLVDRFALIDELVVVDSGSTDATAAVARRAGAAVVAGRDVLVEYGTAPGKGDVLWKAVAATSGDIVLFIDADLEDVSTDFVVGMLGPLLTDDGVGFVKAFYDRPIVTASTVAPSGGGRVTELVARPILNLYWPALGQIVQPLSGEYGGRREVLASIPFASGYGVEIGMLIDVMERYGIESIAQVDLGRRVHRHQPDAALGRMSAHVLQTALRRLHERHGVPPMPPSGTLVQFERQHGEFAPTTHDVAVSERPPIDSLPHRALASARAVLAAELTSRRPARPSPTPG